MVIAFANNQVIAAASGTTSTIYTDPVPLDGNDRVAVHLYIEYLFNAGSGVSYQGQSSNDGVNWVDVTSFTDTQSTAGTVYPKMSAVNAAFLRFKLSYNAAGGIGAGCFDLHGVIDKA
jgi:hypothetical protein